jgi:hypothetical protein
MHRYNATPRRTGWGVRSAQVKEEPAKRAGDKEQNAHPNPSHHQSQPSQKGKKNLRGYLPAPHPNNTPLRI